MLAKNIVATTEAVWTPGALSYDYRTVIRGELNPPERWPIYKIVEDSEVATGQPIRHSGVYVPDRPHSCAQFLNARTTDVAPPAIMFIGLEELYDSTTGEKYGEEPEYTDVSCKWTRVVRSDEVAEFSASFAPSQHEQRVVAGERTPRSGFYFTPAREKSRRHFMQGELMPDFGSQYGLTIWQWDIDQTVQTP